MCYDLELWTGVCQTWKFCGFVSCASTKRSDCRVQKFSLAGSELMDLLKLVVGGNPCKNFGSWCCARIL